MTELTGRLRRILGPHLVGVYLHGSAVLGDFSKARSDIDVCAVSAQPLAAEEQEAIRDQLSSWSLPCSATGVELHIVRTDALSEGQEAPPFEVHLTTDARAGNDRFVDGHGHRGDTDLVLHCAVLREHGVALTGPPASDVFPSVPRRLLLQALRVELRWAADHASPSYQVLNACRAWRFLEEGVSGSKTAGGEWARQRATTRVVVGQALEHRRGASERHPDGEEAKALVEGVRKRLEEELRVR